MGTVEQDIVNVPIDPKKTIADFKALLHEYTGITPVVQSMFYNGQELRNDTSTLEQCQVKEGDMIQMLVRNTPTQARGSGQGQSRGPSQPGRADGRRPASGAPGQDPETTRLHALANPQFLNTIRSYNSDLADAVHDKNRFQQIYEATLRQVQTAQDETEREMARLNEDPFNEENQKKIEEMIRQQRVQENLQHAMDYTPEGECSCTLFSSLNS